MDNWLTNCPISHRGLHKGTEIPENSLTAFQNSINLNYPIELDIQLIKDNNIIVFHDSDLIRICGNARKTFNLTKDSLHKFKLFKSNQKIPLLEEVLELVSGKVPLLIELKNNTMSNSLSIELNKKLKNYSGEVAIQSFNPFSIIWFKDNAPEITRGFLGSKLSDAELAKYKTIIPRRLLFKSLAQPHFVGYDIKNLPKKNVSKIRESGIPILAWTIDSKDKLKKAEKYADNIIFENIDPSGFKKFNK